MEVIMLHQKHKKIPGRYRVAVVHRNNRNIFSIIFEELNITDEKFRSIKKTITHEYSHCFYFAHESSEEVFNRLS
jgi:hypothetical protein